MGKSTARSNLTSASRGGDSVDWTHRVSIYDNNDSISKMNSGEKYTLVQHPLRTKVSTYGGGSLNRTMINQSLQQPIGEPNSTLTELKRLQKERIEEKRNEGRLNDSNK